MVVFLIIALKILPFAQNDNSNVILKEQAQLATEESLNRKLLNSPIHSNISNSLNYKELKLLVWINLVARGLETQRYPFDIYVIECIVSHKA
jgi:hypothetical protein